MYDERIKSLKAGVTRQAIRTADNEFATWLALLMALQRMEKESRQWQEDEFFGYTAPNNEWHTRASHTPLQSTFDERDANNLHTLTVGIQKKKRWWDTMPEHVKKPYATSTICHMVEIMAMLGIHWKVFNQNENRYRAQGNGFLVTGVHVDELGTIFSFRKMGQTWFQENRIVPNETVKELCFGYCPTIFRPEVFKMYADEPKDLRTLQLSSSAAMVETLKVIGCNTKTLEYFSKPTEDTRYSHLFPVAFEMLGMVGIVLQIEGTAFRVLPNPTTYQWDRSSFSLQDLLATYKSFLDEGSRCQKQESQSEPRNVQAVFKNAAQILMIIRETGNIENTFNGPEPNCREPGPKQRTEKPKLSYGARISTLHNAIKGCDRFLEITTKRNMVRSVLQVHLQEVLGMLNLRDTDLGPTESYLDDAIAKEQLNRSTDQTSKTRRRNKQQTIDENRKGVLQRLQCLDSASYEERHTVLIDIYVNWIRENVIEKVCSELDRHRRRQNLDNNRQQAQCTEIPPVGVKGELDKGEVDIESFWPNVKPEEKQEISNIRCVLVFRMLCWLLLHDFHKMDIQIDKDGLFGSRLPVYIA